MFYFANTRKPNFNKIEKINYNRYWQERGFELNKKLKEREEIILDLIPVGAKVLDIGCGNSRLPVVLKAKGCLLTVADISGEVLAGYRQYDLEGWIIDLENIKPDLPDSDYDFIILSEVLEHTTNPEEIILTLKKHTKNFIITIPNSAFYRYRLQLMFVGRFFTQWVYHPSEHLRFWSHLDFLDWLRALDLKMIKTISSNGLSFGGLMPWLKYIWPNLFGHQIVYYCSVKK